MQTFVNTYYATHTATARAEVRIFQEGYLDILVRGIEGTDGEVATEEYLIDIFDFALGRPIYISFLSHASSMFGHGYDVHYGGASAQAQLSLSFFSQDGLPVDIQITPEPATFWLTGGLLAGLVALRRRR